MQRREEPGSAQPVDVAISEPPIAPVVVSFDSSPDPAVQEDFDESARAESPLARRLRAWAIDGAFIVGFLGVDAAAASVLTGRDPLTVVVRAPALWLALAAGLAFAWSAFAVALFGRTAGMALTGQRLQTSQGERPSPLRALIRALLAVAFAACGLFGFVLAAFDPRARTLQDRLCGCDAVVD
jgi:hypothetical protein